MVMYSGGAGGLGVTGLEIEDGPDLGEVTPIKQQSRDSDAALRRNVVRHAVSIGAGIATSSAKIAILSVIWKPQI